MRLSRSEAGKLNTEKSRVVCEMMYQKRVNEYEKSPKVCAHCQSVLDYTKRHNKFCDRSCSVTYNNLKKGKASVNCLSCGVSVLGKKKKVLLQ